MIGPVTGYSDSRYYPQGKADPACPEDHCYTPDDDLPFDIAEWDREFAANPPPPLPEGSFAASAAAVEDWVKFRDTLAILGIECLISPEMARNA